ncbi:MAG: hypothetical protein IPF53_11425 [Blastocatellia bacterium]|nr:hypothetical protein [Blastocatellia bacterium]MBK6428107.1 hypothetical protein [Blastocatellia bacterium]
MRIRCSTVLLFAILTVLVSNAPDAIAQRKGEYLTEGEMNLVRDIRLIDNRSQVFLRIADRRLVAITDPAGPTGDTRFMKYGPLPTGSIIELLDDYRRAVEELMIKLDDEFERTGMTKELRKALESSSTEMDRQIGVLVTIKGRSSGPAFESFHRRAVEAANDLRDGARAALESAP